MMNWCTHCTSPKFPFCWKNYPASLVIIYLLFNCREIIKLLFQYSKTLINDTFKLFRLGCLQEPIPEQAKELIKNVNLLVGEPLAELVFGLPIWKLINTKPYKIYNNASEIVHKISSDLVEQGKQKHLDSKKSQKVNVMFYTWKLNTNIIRITF